MDHGLSQVQAGLGKPDELDGLSRRRRYPERVRVGHADVLAREDHEAPCDVPRVLAGLDEPRHPVEAGVRVRAAQRS